MPGLSQRPWPIQNIQDEAISERPRIELHPQDHVYREPATQYLDWRVTSEFRRPDGVSKRVYLINGLFPGPTVEVRSGDTLIITVTNALSDDLIAIHWHGLHVANAMDGAAGISQCAVNPGGQFVYNLTIPSDQSGTFWYHAHSGVSRGDGLYGGLVVHAPASKSTVRGLLPQRDDNPLRYTYDRELLLLIGDWYHRPAGDVLEWYMDPGNFGNEPVPDSMLINGAGYFDCTMAVPARPVDCIDQQVNTSFIDLDPNATYRIRVVNTGALAGLSLIFDNHLLDLLQVDSVDVARSNKTNRNSIGTLFPGQRMDFVLQPLLPISEKQSHMRVRLDQDSFNYANPALTPDQTFPINYRSDAVEGPPIEAHHLNIGEAPSAPSILSSIPPTAQQTHVVYTKIQKMARYSNKPFGYFNQTTWKPQQDPPIPLASIPRTRWDANQFAITTGPEPTWIDLVVNNLDDGSHPFHMHGHHFYVLAVHQAEFGWGSYNPFIDKIPPHLEPDLGKLRNSTDDARNPNTGYNSGLYDTSRAAFRDTVQIPSRGYAVLRFRADNPGVWLFHCHMLWHSATGMVMLIDVQGDPAGLAAHAGSGGLCPAS
ncbi:Multicopper oxidase, type 3 [Penicillium expansum]|uniref:Multicopper oxidase, type 3 n=1 Tax=Penicillium expansum TaxID=27334 RepID=A0A0A2I6R6_PENEN|nr:Multicopper oxidase, type 3 [Penicillium expansum]KGO38739.1 Multicopper oxidase, type 3 [Penicillium expansum]KGO45565.1 Multicopper oxidase, type 3 [Penicillium expansum]KGO54266.1 Multicopper oxidase, type 3 [Penicillium expansum]